MRTRTLVRGRSFSKMHKRVALRQPEWLKMTLFSWSIYALLLWCRRFEWIYVCAIYVGCIIVLLLGNSHPYREAIKYSIIYAIGLFCIASFLVSGYLIAWFWQLHWVRVTLRIWRSIGAMIESVK